MLLAYYNGTSDCCKALTDQAPSSDVPVRASAKDCLTTANMRNDIDYILALQFRSKITRYLRRYVQCGVVLTPEMVDRKCLIVAQGVKMRVG